MSLILILAVEILLGSMLKDIIPYDILEWILVGANAIIVGLYLSIKVKSKKTFYILYVAYLVRLVFMYSDLYRAPLPFSGGDTWSFHNTGIKIADALPYKLLESPYGAYAQFVGFIYYFMGGPVKMFAQNINIILFIVSTISILEILNIYKVSNKYIDRALMIYTCFMPVAMFQSCILLREMLIVLFMTLSICSILKWLNNYGSIHVVSAFLFLFLASVFHSGLVFTILPYTFIVGTYDSRYKKFIVTPKSIMLLMLVVVAIIVGFTIFGDYFVHLEGMEDFQSILDSVNRTEIAKQSGSGYLAGLKVVGAVGLVLLTPLKELYFLFSPMPWQIRGGMDLITFVLDSMLYVILIRSYINMKNEKHKIPQHIYNVVRMLYVTYLIMMIPYAWGTFAAGTAIRHRFKAFSILLIAYSIYTYYLNEYEEEKNLVRS